MSLTSEYDPVVRGIHHKLLRFHVSDLTGVDKIILPVPLYLLVY